MEKTRQSAAKGRSNPGLTDLAVDTGAVDQMDGFIAVGLFDALHLGGDSVIRFVPANADEFPFSPLANAFHRIFEPVRIIEPLPLCPSLQAGPGLRELSRIRGVVGGDTSDDAVFYMGIKETAAAAVVNATGGNNGGIVRCCRTNFRSRFLNNWKGRKT